MHDCNICLCRERCYHLIEYEESPYHCDYYKDESLYIKSPCPIGTTLYIRHEVKRSDDVWVQPVTVVGLHLRDEKSQRGLPREEYLVVRGDYGFSKHIPFKYIGTKVFFSKKEAMEYKGDK